jgi:hypothetical protein
MDTLSDLFYMYSSEDRKLKRVWIAAKSVRLAPNVCEMAGGFPLQGVRDCD